MSNRMNGIKQNWASACCVMVCAIASTSVHAQRCGELPSNVLHPAAHDGLSSFARVMATSADRLVSGGPNANANGASSGVAHVFAFDGVQWAEEATIFPSDIRQGQRFGSTVAIHGDLLVVGSAEEDTHGHGSGAAYVFRFDGSGWVEEAKLFPSDPDRDVYFSSSVAVENNTVMVGARGAESGSGAVYVFEFDGSAWVQEAKLLGSGDSQASFGKSVAMTNGVAAVGSAHGNLGTGSVHIFQRENGNWEVQSVLTASDADTNDNFGASLAMTGDLLVIGAVGNTDVGNGGGASYVFRHNGVDWVEEQALFATDGFTIISGFGEAVALNHERIVVADVGNTGYIGELLAGAVYVFGYDGTQWVEEGKLAQPGAQGLQSFGMSVGIENGSVFAGTSFADGVGVRTGAVFEYDISSLDIEACLADFDDNCLLNFFDISAFLRLFASLDPATDLNGDGSWNFFDASAFLDSYGDGCP